MACSDCVYYECSRKYGAICGNEESDNYSLEVEPDDSCMDYEEKD